MIECSEKDDSVNFVLQSGANSGPTLDMRLDETIRIRLLNEPLINAWFLAAIFHITICRETIR